MNEVSDFYDHKQISFSRFYISWIGLSPLVFYLLSYFLLPLLPPPPSHTPASVLSLIFWLCIVLWTLLPFQCLLTLPFLRKIFHKLPLLGKYCLPKSVWAFLTIWLISYNGNSVDSLNSADVPPMYPSRPFSEEEIFISQCLWLVFYV